MKAAEKNIIIAKITAAHGIKGHIKLISFAANPADIIKYLGKVFDAKNQPRQLKIINQIPGKNSDLFVAQIDGILNRNQAELLKNTELFIKRSDLKKSKKDEFYYVDLVGLDVLNIDKKKIGKVAEVNDFGAGGLVEIEFTKEELSKKKNNKNEITNFIFTGKIFPEVNIEKGYLVLDIPDVIEIKDDA